jgi:hypothetical protein
MRKLQQRQRNDLSRSVTALDMDTALIAVVEMSLSSGLVAGIVPGREQMTLMRIFEGLRGRGCLPRRCTQPRNGSPNSSPRLVGGTITVARQGDELALAWFGSIQGKRSSRTALYRKSRGGEESRHL